MILEDSTDQFYQQEMKKYETPEVVELTSREKVIKILENMTTEEIESEFVTLLLDYKGDLIQELYEVYAI